jgi:hypothetical protein
MIKIRTLWNANTVVYTDLSDNLVARQHPTRIFMGKAVIPLI